MDTVKPDVWQIWLQDYYTVNTSDSQKVYCHTTPDTIINHTPRYPEFSTQDFSKPNPSTRQKNIILCLSQLATITNILQQLKPELIAKYHISSIGLFGSVVRDDFSSSSDVDIIVDFNHPIGIEFIELADFIEKNLISTSTWFQKKVSNQIITGQ